MCTCEFHATVICGYFLSFCFWNSTLFVLLFFADETFIIALMYNFVLHNVCFARNWNTNSMQLLPLSKSTIVYVYYDEHMLNVLQLLMQFYLLYLTMLGNCKNNSKYHLAIWHQVFVSFYFDRSKEHYYVFSLANISTEGQHLNIIVGWGRC